jgi:hypothetical protein
VTAVLRKDFIGFTRLPCRVSPIRAEKPENRVRTVNPQTLIAS